MARVGDAPTPSAAISRPSPLPAPPPPPTTPADTPRRRRDPQVTKRISENVTNCQEASKHTKNEVHHSGIMSRAKGMRRPDLSEKQRMPKSSGSLYSKPEARVKLIPVEEITYVKHRKPYHRTVRSAGLQKKHCRRSITPPPSSRKVSVVPVPSVPSDKLSRKSFDTAENAESLVQETSSVTQPIASVKDPAPPSCKSSQPSTSSNTGTIMRDFGRMGIQEAFSRYYGSRILHSQYQSSEWPYNLEKEAAIYFDSATPKLAPRSSEDHLGSKAGDSSKSEEFLSPACVFLQQLTVVYPDRIRTAAPILRKHISPSPLSLLSVRSNEVCSKSKSAPKEVLISPISPSPKRALSPCSAPHLDAKAGSPKILCTPENGKPCSTSCNITTRSTAAAVLQSSVVESVLLNPTPVLDERSRELYPDGTRAAADPIQQKQIVKHVLPSPSSLLSEKSKELYPNSKDGLKEAVVNHLSPSHNQVFVPCSSEGYLGIKGGPPSNSVCTPENELCSRSCNLAARTIAGPVLQSPDLESALLSHTSVLGETSTDMYSDRISTAVPIQKDPVVGNVLPSPTSLLSERSTEVHPNSSTGLCISNKLFKLKCDMVSLQRKSIPLTHSMQSMAPAQCGTLIDCDTSSEFRHEGIQETRAPAILHTKLHRKHYQSEAPWKGNFHVTGDLRHICDGIEAHFPFQISVRVYEASKQMPQILKLEAVALSQLWPKTFRMKPPDGEDIGICFISSNQRMHRSFEHLLEKISSHFGLWTKIGGTELSIFSSKLLLPDYQSKDGKFYFWGTFGKNMRKNQCHRSSHITSMINSNLNQPNGEPGDKPEDKETESVQPGNGIAVDSRRCKGTEMGKSMETRSTIHVNGDKLIVSDKNDGLADLDLTGANETDRVNESAAVPGTSNSYSASSCAAPAGPLLNGCCNRDTANKSTFSVAGLSLKNDRANECDKVLGTHDSKSAPNRAATASLLHGCCSHGSANKSTSSLADSPCQPGNISSAGSDLMLGTPNLFSPKTDRINGCDVVLGTPNSNHASSFDSPLNRCFGHDWNKSTFSLSVLTDSPCQPANTSSAGSHLMLDTNPESSLHVPPGFIKAHCRAEDDDVSYVNAPPNVVVDTPGFSCKIPPGFTEADRRLPRITSTEPETGVSTVTEKPLIRFSLNVPKLVRTGILPGFTMPNAVKKEPESPASDKAKEKVMPSPLASGSSSVREAAGMRITRDEATVEDDGNSEEREFPKIRRLSDLYGTPRRCAEVSRTVTSNQADKFQATERPEKQRRVAKNGMQESLEPFLADTAKRLKVNGRLALNSNQPHRSWNK